MGILKTRFERATDVPLIANALVRGGRLVKLAAVGDHAHKPKVEETAASTDLAVGAAAVDAAAGQNVTVTMSRGLMLLTSSEPIAFNVDVYPSSGGRVQATGSGTGGAIAAGDRAFGYSWSATDAADQLLWVKPYN